MRRGDRGVILPELLIALGIAALCAFVVLACARCGGGSQETRWGEVPEGQVCTEGAGFRVCAAKSSAEARSVRSTTIDTTGPREVRR